MWDSQVETSLPAKLVDESSYLVTPARERRLQFGEWAYSTGGMDGQWKILTHDALELSDQCLESDSAYSSMIFILFFPNYSEMLGFMLSQYRPK